MYEHVDYKHTGKAVACILNRFTKRCGKLPNESLIADGMKSMIHENYSDLRASMMIGNKRVQVATLMTHEPEEDEPAPPHAPGPPPPAAPREPSPPPPARPRGPATVQTGTSAAVDKKAVDSGSAGASEEEGV